jgi:hypothetical protein
LNPGVVVLHVESGGQVRRFSFDRTFTIGTFPDCTVALPPAPDPYTVVVFVLADRARVGAGNRRVPAALDGHDIDLDRRHELHAGNMLVIPGATIRIEQVPERPNDFDDDAARKFDRDLRAQIASEPPPRRPLDSTELTMEHVTRSRPQDPARLVSRPPQTLGELEAALGLAFPVDLYVTAGVYIGPGPSSDHDVHSLSATLVLGTLTLAVGSIEDTRHNYLDHYRIEWSRGRPHCESALSTTSGGPIAVRHEGELYRVYGNFVVDARDTDAFSLSWYSKRPDWAVPCDEVLRAGWLSELAATLAACARLEDLAARLGHAAASAGIRTDQGDSGLSIELAPTIAAPALVLALGWSEMAWQRAHGHDDVPYVLVHTRDERLRVPRIGRWRLSCHLDAAFPGGPVHAGNPYLRTIVAADRVRYLQIEY